MNTPIPPNSRSPRSNRCLGTRTGVALTLLLAAGLGVPHAVHAFTISPIVNRIEIEESNRTTYELRNNGNAPVAIEITARSRSLSTEGEEIRDETDALAVFPSQIVLNTGERQTVNVEYTGDPSHRHEEAFRVIATEVPVDFEEDETPAPQGSLDFTLTYETALYVTSDPDGAADVRVADVQLSEDELVVSVTNDGVRHAVLSEAEIELFDTAGDSVAVFEGDVLGRLNGLNLLAGHTVTLSLPGTDELQNDIDPDATEIRYSD